MSLKEKTTEIKDVITNFKDSLNKLLNIVEGSSSKGVESSELLNDGLLYLMDIRDLNCEIQKVTLLLNFTSKRELSKAKT